MVVWSVLDGAVPGGAASPRCLLELHDQVGRLRAGLAGSTLLFTVVAVGLLAGTLWALASRSRPAGVCLLLAAVAWLAVNQRVEGPTVLPLTARHGVTASDLLSVLAAGLAVWSLARPRRRPA